MQSTGSKKEREKQTFNIQGIQNSSLEITVNLARSPNRWKRNAVQGLRLGKGPEAGVGETFCMSLFTESRASSINVFALASYLCTGLFSQSWYWKVSAYLWLFISLMFSCHFLTWQMWVALGTQAPAICLVQLPQMAKPALAAVLGMDLVSLLLSRAASSIASRLGTPLERKSEADWSL